MELNYLQKYIKYKNKYCHLIAGTETPPSYSDVSKTSTDAFIYSLGFTKSQIDYARKFPKYDIFIKHLINQFIFLLVKLTYSYCVFSLQYYK